MPDLAHCIERHHPDPGNVVGRWARQFLPQGGSNASAWLRRNVLQCWDGGVRRRIIVSCR
jgi:hypothetical protein